MVTGLLTTSYPRFPGDHAGSFVADRVRQLRTRGEQVHVIAAGEPAEDAFADPWPVRRIAFAVRGAKPLFYGAGAPETFDAGAAGSWLSAARFFAGLCAEVGRRARDWDRIESHWLVPCALAAVTAAPGRPLRAYAHSGDIALLEKLPLGFGAAIARRLVRPDADLVFVSSALRDRFAALAGRSCGVVEQLAVDGNVFQPAPPPMRVALRRARNLDRPTVLGVGRLVPIKGFDVLLHAVARLGPSRPMVVLLGDGPERPRLARMAAALDVELRLPGSVLRAEVAAYLQAADAYVQPSRILPGGRTEGLPVALLEALATGLPVVGTTTGGMAELESAITLVPPESPAQLAAALANILRRSGKIRPVGEVAPA